MTFKEALSIKKALPETITYNKTQMLVYVVPKEENDFNRYMTNFYINPINDDTARLFSSNGEFTVYGLSKIGNWNMYLTFNDLLKAGHWD